MYNQYRIKDIAKEPPLAMGRLAVVIGFTTAICSSSACIAPMQDRAKGSGLAARPLDPRLVAVQTTPAGAQNVLHRFLSRGLAGAVNPQWIARLLGAVGVALAAVEHEIGAHLQQPSARFHQGLGEGMRGTAIHCMGHSRAGLHRRSGAPSRPALLGRFP
jgi:hypothetical protein